MIPSASASLLSHGERRDWSSQGSVLLREKVWTRKTSCLLISISREIIGRTAESGFGFLHHPGTGGKALRNQPAPPKGKLPNSIPGKVLHPHARFFILHATDTCIPRHMSDWFAGCIRGLPKTSTPDAQVHRIAIPLGLGKSRMRDGQQSQIGHLAAHCSACLTACRVAHASSLASA